MKNRIVIALLSTLALGIFIGWASRVPEKTQTSKLEILDSKGRIRLVAGVDSLDNPFIITLDSTGKVKGTYN